MFGVPCSEERLHLDSELRVLRVHIPCGHRYFYHIWQCFISKALGCLHPEPLLWAAAMPATGSCEEKEVGEASEQ